MMTAPKSDPSTTDAAPYVLLLFTNGMPSVGYWDWFYAEGGFGYQGGTAWIEPVSGERLDLHYGPPILWAAIPPAPVA